MDIKNYFKWGLQVMVAIILIQTLRFKFTADPVSVHIFSTIGIEPWGRIMIGVFELIAGVLLLIPSVALYGALLSVGLMAGAIFFHLTLLGVVVQGDGGSLFGLAIFTLAASLLIVYLRCDELKKLLSRFHKR